MELRKDYILNRWVIISKTRGKRPDQFKQEADIYAGDPGPTECHFCPGNEDKTPPEWGRIKDEQGNWKIRWYKNLFPAVETSGKHEIETHNHFFTFSNAYGHHEVIAETNDHKKQYWDFSDEELVEILNVYANRIDELSGKPNIKYVSVFKNHGKRAGTSIIHSHSQAISLNVIPHEVQIKLDATKKFESCPYCDLVKEEAQGIRKIHENESCLAFAPYASRFNMEAWIFPKNHYKTLHDFSEKDMKNLAQCMKIVLDRLKSLNVAFNMCLFYTPKGEDMHFHIEFMPRIQIPAGFELGSGVYINVVPPEDAAAWYRGEHTKKTE
ncbi:galactose-1-phosphate uridylyltransferase [Nanoarchaeota archaeon]